MFWSGIVMIVPRFNSCLRYHAFLTQLAILQYFNADVYFATATHCQSQQSGPNASFPYYP